MTKKVHLQITEADYVRLLIPIIGKENCIYIAVCNIVVPLHNRIVMSIVRSALRRQREKQCQIQKLKRVETNNANTSDLSPSSQPPSKMEAPPNKEQMNCTI